MEEMEKLYSKIVAVEAESDKPQKFLTVLKEFGDDEFVRCNFETRICNDPFNMELWKVYLEYLQEENTQELLQCYSKYCRLFWDDYEMKFKYEQEVRKRGRIIVPWRNLFDFESYYSNASPTGNSDNESDYEMEEEAQILGAQVVEIKNIQDMVVHKIISININITDKLVRKTQNDKIVYKRISISGQTHAFTDGAV